MRAVEARPRVTRDVPAPAAESESPATAEARDAGTETVPRGEALAVFGLAGVLYVLLGLWVVGELHVVDFGSLERLAHADMAWHGDPPKLAAVGFENAPLGTLLLLPLALFGGLVTSALAIPITSALCAAGTLVFLDRTLAVGSMGRGPRLVLVALVALNPMFAFYATNGAAEAPALLLAAIALYCVLSWAVRDSPRHLIGAGLAIAVGALADYELIWWGLLLGLVVAAALTRLGRDRGEAEGSVIAFLAPLAYALGTWLLLNAVILGDPFAWISTGDGPAPVNAVGPASESFDLAGAAGDALQTQLIFPLALLALPLLLLARDVVAKGIACLIALAVAYPVVVAAAADSADVIDLRSALLVIVAGCAGLAWLHLRAPGERPLIRAAGILLAAAALPLAWAQMDSFPNQGLEGAFVTAASTGEDQEGVATAGGVLAGTGREEEMARFIDEQGVGEGRVLTDRARTFGVIAMTGRPELFLDRTSAGSEAWEEVLSEPAGRVDFALVALGGGDRILAAHPGADAGESPIFEPFAGNDRYALLRVAEPEPAPAAGE